MPRLARTVIPDCPHHITQRGNNRQDVFFVADDYRLYLDILREQSARFGLDLHAYCLMTNHIHIVATPRDEDSLAKAVGRTHWLYSQTVNRLHGRSGHLWQGRFYSCALDNPHLWAAVKYVERNPVRAKIVSKAWDYEWSSAAAHCSATDKCSLLDLRQWSKMFREGEWRQELSHPDDASTLRALRNNTSRGWPLASDNFISKFEKIIGKRLRRLPHGRPRKQK